MKMSLIKWLADKLLNNQLLDIGINNLVSLGHAAVRLNYSSPLLIIKGTFNDESTRKIRIRP